MALPDKGRKWTIEEYEEFSQQAEDKYEFYYGEVYPVYPPEPGQPQSMAGATENHTIITGNIFGFLFAQLLGKPCNVFQSDVKVEASADARFFPDVLVVCGERRYKDAARMILLNPTVIFEVLSPSTQRYDRTIKFDEYRTMPSVQAYVLVSQERMHIMHYARQADDAWMLRYLTQPEDVLELPAVGCTLRVADVYRQVTFKAEGS